MYKCAICGKEYDTISERAKCEAECLKIQESEAAAKKMADERAKRDVEREESLKKLRALKKECEDLEKQDDEIHAKYVRKKREYDQAYMDHVDKFVTKNAVAFEIPLPPLFPWFS